MKKFILIAVFIAAGVLSISQTQDVMIVKLKDGTLHEFKVEEVRELSFWSYEISPSGPVAEAIDLGLPAGTKWASWNIGASAPEEYGGYYAWGETEEKYYYDSSTYTHWDGYIGYDIAGTEYDVAHVKWGGSWRMPSRAQLKELVENCTREWKQQNGVNGTLVTGPNGNSIFLPAAGNRSSDDLCSEGSRGYCWSSSRSPNYMYDACGLLFDESPSWGCYGYSPTLGFSVRAVCP